MAFRAGFFAVVVALAVCISCHSSQALEPAVHPALIPLQDKVLEKAAERYQLYPGDPLKIVGKPEHYIGFQPIRFLKSKSASLSINAFTGDPEILSYRKSSDLKGQSSVLAELQAENAALSMVRQFYPDPDALESWWKSQRDSDSTYQISLRGLGRTRELNQCRIHVNLKTGLPDFYAHSYRKTISPVSSRILTAAEAVSLGRWAIYQKAGDQIRVQILVPSEFNDAQKSEWKKSGLKTNEDASLVINEDAWFNQRLVWEVNFNFNQVFIDATTGEIIHIAGVPVNPIDTDWKVFAVDNAPKLERPAQVYSPSVKSQHVDVNFNDEVIEAGVPYFGLHFPPIEINGNVLLAAEYFPLFLIDVKKKESDLELRGRLETEGTKVTAKTGAMAAMVNGRQRVLSSAPVVVNDKLYLPAELLQICNGIPVRWDARKKFLTIDTRSMRRRGDETATFTVFSQ